MTDAEIVIGIRGEISGGKNVQRTLDDIERSGQRAQNSTTKLKNQFGGLNSAANTLSNTLRGLGVAFGLRQLQQMADSYTNIENRLRLVTSSTEELKGVQGELNRISIESRSSLEATATLYSRLTFATKGLGISQAEVLKFTEQLNKQLLVGGSAAQEAAATVFQLTQAFNKGKLDGDEFRTVLEAAPTILEALEISLGKTRSAILAMAADGKLGPAELVKAVNDMADVTNKRFAEMGATIGQGFEVLKTKTIGAVGDLNDAIGATDFLGVAMSKLGDVIGVVFNDLASLAFALKGLFTDVVGSILSITTAIVNGLENVVNKAIDGINLLRKQDIKYVDFTGGLTSNDIVSAQTEMSAEDYKKAGTALTKANNSAATFAGYQMTTPFKASTSPGSITPKGPTKEQTDAQKAIDKTTDSLKFQLEQLKRNDLEQAIHNNLKQAGVSLDSQAGQNIARLTREYELNSEQLEQQEKIINGVSGATEGFFKSWITGADGFKGAVKGMIGQLVDLAFQMSVIEPIKRNLFGGTASSGSGLLGSIIGAAGSIFGGGVSASVAAASARGVANPALFGPGFASGGSMVLGGHGGVDQNQLSLNGAPIARVGRGETLSVSPGQKNNGNGIVINQTINVSTGVQDTIRAEMMNILPQLQKSTRAAIQDASARGYD